MKHRSAVLHAAFLVMIAATLAAPVAPASAQSFTEFSIPTADAGPHGITTGPDGNLWFTERSGDKIGQMTRTGTLTEYPLPAGTSPVRIATGPDGNLWFTAGQSKISKLTTTGTLTEYPLANTTGAIGITAGPDGNIWFTEFPGNKIGRMTTSGVLTEYDIPSPNSEPTSIVTGPDGNLWFTEYHARKIGKLTPTGTLTEYETQGDYSASLPSDIITGPDGNLWFTDYRAVTKMTTAGTMTRYFLEPGSGSPLFLTTGPDGNLWFTNDGDHIGRITPTGTITLFRIPNFDVGHGVAGITTGPDDNLWFTQITTLGTNEITRFTPPHNPHEGPPGDPNCSDGLDDDGDGLVDGADPGCTTPCEDQPDLCNGFDDNCDGSIDEGFPDFDRDGIADCIDQDQENDGFLDGDDNCPTIHNFHQEDSDADGIGDFCDPDTAPIVNPPSATPITVDGQFEPSAGEWADVTPASFLGGDAKVYTALDSGQDAIYLLYDFSLSTIPVNLYDEVGPISFKVGASSFFQVFISQGGPDTNFGPNPATSEGGLGDGVRVLLNGEPFDNSAGCVAGGVDFNSTSPNFPGLAHNVVELEIHLTGSMNGCYSPEPAFWSATLPGVEPLPLVAMRSVGMSEIFTVSRSFVNVDTGTGTTTVSPLPPPLDHFKCYKAQDLKSPQFLATTVTLTDQFETKTTVVLKPALFCSPVDKNGEGINDATAHLTCYKIKDGKNQAKFPGANVEVTNQLGTLRLNVKKAALACLPSTANGVPSALDLDHFKCYGAKDLKAPAFVPETVTLADGFESKITVVQKPAFLCNPADKNGEGIRNRPAHLTCYKIKDEKNQAKFPGADVATVDQLGALQLSAQKAALACIPSTKTVLP